MNGSFHRVTDSRTHKVIWLALLNDSDERMWTYDRYKKVFWRNDALTVDFFVDQTLDYEAISDAEAVTLAKSAPLMPRDVRDIFVADKVPCVKESEVFTIPTQRPGLVRKRRVEGIASAKPGHWVTWKTYGREHEKAARVAASDARLGKVKSLTGLVTDANVLLKNDGWVVQVLRASNSPIPSQAGLEL